MTESNKKKVYAVMLFFTEIELGISTVPNKWVNIKNVKFDNGADAVNYYANTKCPASQLIDAESEEELIEKMNQMIKNFNNQEWLDNDLYPYL